MTDSKLEALRAELIELRTLVHSLPSAQQTLMVRRANEKARRLRAVGTMPVADALDALAAMPPGDVRQTFEMIGEDTAIKILCAADSKLRDRLLAPCPPSLAVQVRVAITSDDLIPRHGWIRCTGSQPAGYGQPSASITPAFAKVLVGYAIGGVVGGTYRLPSLPNGASASGVRWPLAILERLRGVWPGLDDAIARGTVLVTPCDLVEDRQLLILAADRQRVVM